MRKKPGLCAVYRGIGVWWDAQNSVTYLNNLRAVAFLAG